MLISDWVAKFQEQRPVGVLLDDEQVTALFIEAANHYSGYGSLEAHLAIDPLADAKTYPEITAATDITVSEYAVINQLFLLFVERETALQLEASRGLGIDQFGRTTSEIEGDIANFLLELPHKAFQVDAFSVWKLLPKRVRKFEAIY